MITICRPSTDSDHFRPELLLFLDTKMQQSFALLLVARPRSLSFLLPMIAFLYARRASLYGVLTNDWHLAKIVSYIALI